MRPLEDHLSPQELASLPSFSEARASEGQEQLMFQHLAQCVDCLRLSQAQAVLVGLRSLDVAVDRDLCPQDEIWLEFAAGLRPSESSTLLAHAASCRLCANALKEALDLIIFDQVDISSSPEELIPDLASSDPAWQRQVAAKMMAADPVLTEGASTPLRTSFMAKKTAHPPSWLTWSVAAVLFVGVVATFTIFWRSTHPSEAKLLALAYNKQRITALRIPGGQPVEMASTTRSGEGATEGLTEPSELLELRLRAQRHLDQSPNSPYWHQILGEIELLRKNGLAARRNFEIAQASDASLPNLLPDLAGAWFEVGESTGKATDYAQAEEKYLEELQNLKNGKVPPTGAALLHYNLALCLERQGQTDEALVQLNAALSLEKASAWRAAIRSEINRLSNHPISGHSSDTREADGYEAALNDAISNLLPEWDDPADPTAQAMVRAEIRKTAAVGALHHDRWLSDWIASSHTALSKEADHHLAASVRAAATGDAELSLAEAAQARMLYNRLDNSAGKLRAEYAETYADQRLGRTKDCIAMAASITRSQKVEAYSSIHTRALLDEAICESRDGSFASATRNTDRVIALAAAAGLPQNRLFALTMQAGTLHAIGRTSAAWQADVAGLRACEEIHCAPVRRYSFLYFMVRNAQDLGLPLTAASVMQAAVPVAAASADKVTYAYALETLGSVLGRIGEYDASSKAFAEAARVAESGHQAALADIYQAEWKIDQAEIFARQGRPQAALQLIQQSASVVLASDYLPGRTKYFQQASISELAVQNFDSALANARAAVESSELSLSSLHTPDAREQWTRENSAVYAQLIKVYLGRGDDTAAFQIWERFRSVPYGAPVSSTGVLVSHKDLPQARVIVLARIDDSYIGWLATAQPLRVLRTVRLGSQGSLLPMATTFYRLCADRDSSLADVHAVGARLYAALLEPLLGKDPSGSDPIAIELDPSLGMLPLAALTLPNGSWFGDSAPPIGLAPWWSIAPTSNLPSVSPNLHLLLINGFDRNQNDASESSEIARIFPHSRLIDGTTLTSKTVLQELGSAELFHFSGHASATQLVFASSERREARTLSPQSLDGVRLPHCRIAVLAACNTTAADPDQIEKLPDLRNALLHSGVGAVVASIWDVDDRSTRSLMLGFYRPLALGTPPAQALRSAQQSIRSTGEWGHPFYWAAFQLFTT
jgi:CHAT domain-containing protein